MVRIPAFTAAIAFVVAAATAAAVSSPSDGALNQPVAPQRPVIENHFGTRTTDPYRYFEDLKRPDVMQWLDAQAKYTDAAVAKIPGRAALFDRLHDLADSSGDSLGGIVERGGGLLFYLKRAADGNQFKLYVRKNDGSERVLVDPEALEKTTGMPHAINYFVPSWDGKYVACGVSTGGSEQAVLHIVDVASGAQLGKPVSRADAGGLTSVVWTPDSHAVLFNRLKEYPADAPAEDHYKNSTVFELAVGADESAARPVFGAGTSPSLHLQPLDYASMTASPDSAWIVATVNDTTDAQYQVWVLSAADLGKPNAAWRQIARVADGVSNVALRGNELFMLSHSGAPNFRLLRLDLRRGGAFADATVVVPEQPGTVRDFTAGGDALYLTVRDAFNVAIWRASYADGKLSRVTLPVNGSAGIVYDDAHLRTGVLASAQSWTDAEKLFAWGSGTGARELPLRDPGRFNHLPDVEVTDVEVPSHDGVMVPLVIVAKKGVALDGRNPTILYGYGSYGLTPYDPSFSATLYAWLERGGIFAVAGVRGGGEFGERWHQAGVKINKPNTWKDGVACAEYLIAKRYTSAAHLAAIGGSAGGIFAGRLLTSRPDLFRAVVIQVGMTDTLRSEFSANGVTNISEFGTVADPQGFKGLLEMSTYHHIVDGTAYPAVLLTHGLNDPRVDVWESLKTAARLQKASTSGRPVLLRIERQAGHGIGSTRNQRMGEAADTYSFLLWQFGDAAFQPQ